MRYTRPISELLQLVLNTFNSNYSGLCTNISDLYYNDIITWEETIKLKCYVHENRPKYNFFSAKFNGVNPQESMFFWEPFKVKPRIKWLKKHIKKNKL